MEITESVTLPEYKTLKMAHMKILHTREPGGKAEQLQQENEDTEHKEI